MFKNLKDITLRKMGWNRVAQLIQSLPCTTQGTEINDGRFCPSGVKLKSTDMFARAIKQTFSLKSCSTSKSNGFSIKAGWNTFFKKKSVTPTDFLEKNILLW